MSIVIPRLLGAVSGFVHRYKRLPTRVIVPLDNWREYKANPNSVFAVYPDAIGRQVFERVDLIPIPRQVYIATNEEGDAYDYGEEDFPPDDALPLLEKLLAEASKEAR